MQPATTARRASASLKRARVRITVTPLGAVGQSASSVARRIVDYLEGKEPSPARQLLNPDATPDRAVRYFGDSMEGPGRWLGHGAQELGLEGTVTADQLRWVLAGRHPATGQRLLGATGSSGRKHLAVGTAARLDANGEPLYETRDVAALLGLTTIEIDAMVAAGKQLPLDEQPATADWLRSVSDPADPARRLVREREVERWLGLTGGGVTADAIRLSGPPDEELTPTQAARMLGVSGQYVRRLCLRYSKSPLRFEAGKGKGEWIRCTRRSDAGQASYAIARSDLAEFAGRRKIPAVRCGFDLTLTTEKSFGVLMMLSQPDRRQVFEHALDRANDEAIDYLERHAAYTRKRGERVPTTGLLVASYLHGTSRALDPFPHRHNVAANTALDANGDRKALDARAFYEQAPVAAALATARMRWLLTTALGVTWRRSPRGVWEVAGVPDDVLDEFSQRRNAIEAVVAELEDELGRPISKTEERTVVLETRAEKVATTIAALLAEWRDRASQHGFDPATIEDCFERDEQPIPLTRSLRNYLFERLAGPDGLTANLNWFTRGDVIRAIVDFTLRTETNAERLLVLPPDQVEALADDFLCDLRVVQLETQATGSDAEPKVAKHAEPTFTTIDLLEVQDRIRRRFALGVDANVGAVSTETVERVALAERTPLDHSQVGMVKTFCTSGMRVQLCVGPPGSGKTTALATAARAWEADGYRVFGAAVKGEAARLLGAAAAIETNTLAWVLHHDDPRLPMFDSRTVVIVDEATTIADRDLERLIELADRTGCTLRLVGDPAQHGSVGAGGSFAGLVRLHEAVTPQLTGSHRLRDPAERDIAELVRAGKIENALNAMASAGKLVEAATDTAAQATVLARWWQSRCDTHHHPMVDRLNTNRRTLNAIARELRIAAGEVECEGLDTADGRRFSVGDEVIARRPDRQLHVDGAPDRYVRNGSRGTITCIEDENIEVEFSDLGRISLPRAFIDDRDAPGLDLAYAVTSYAIQGATNIISTSVLTPQSNRAEMYVDVTRGRNENVAVAVVPPIRRDDEPHLPRLPPPPTLEAVTVGIASRTGEASAIDQDPLALPASRRRSAGGTASIDQVSQRARRMEDAARQRASRLLTAPARASDDGMSL